ncbi:MAG: hypothetical protein EOL86_00645 [Deltaproteobacteria bacterium]|nr:hypothetical protein [Deltaproteobacteria bacterium]
MCKRCKTVTDHHVVVMDGDKIAKVECKVCGGRHAFQSATPAPKAKPKTTTPRAPKGQSAAAQRRQSAAVEAVWEKNVAGSVPQPYAMTFSFKAGDVIDHPTFGLGHVQKMIAANTMEVLFHDGIRNLRCAPGK